MSAKALFDAVADGRVHLAASALTEAEIGCFAQVRDGGQEIHDKVRTWLDAPPPGTRYIEVDRLLARDAQLISRTLHEQDPKAKQLRTLDAVHMAAAIRLGCDYLMTQDDNFPIGQTVEGVRVRLTEQVWESTLLDGI